jgi:hypothetical protein
MGKRRHGSGQVRRGQVDKESRRLAKLLSLIAVHIDDSFLLLSEK